MPDDTITPTPRLATTERPATTEPGAPDPVVVLLHGLGCERGQFAAQIRGLHPRLRLLSLDLPGHGASPRPRTEDHGLTATARAVTAELHARHHQGVILVGHSAGGLVALTIAAEHPHLTRGIVLLDTNLTLDDTTRQANRSRARQAETGDWRQHFTASMLAAWGSGHHPDEDPLASVLRTLQRTPESVLRPLWNEILTLDAIPLWRRCRVPSLYVRTKRGVDLRRLRLLNPRASAIDLRPQCDTHWPHVRCPDTVNEILNRFAAHLEPGREG
ncbi:alpha/beta hydrolase [Actinoallomurus spadix]|uniref:Alpha/beta hydrolase n=1 Tax=Actinoallomurus spadix TaxID=79912 RepID=A0ABP3GHY2_9ACTN|nr:alpha/beta hydrolase [Actinoallomurus spadix]MCO5990983.1 alpha/beta hydrolase [Actinoallomurus spadix]